jgi:hypothetical protein
MKLSATFKELPKQQKARRKKQREELPMRKLEWERMRQCDPQQWRLQQEADERRRMDLEDPQLQKLRPERDAMGREDYLRSKPACIRVANWDMAWVRARPWEVKAQCGSILCVERGFGKGELEVTAIIGCYHIHKWSCPINSYTVKSTQDERAPCRLCTKGYLRGDREPVDPYSWADAALEKMRKRFKYGFSYFNSNVEIEAFKAEEKRSQDEVEPWHLAWHRRQHTLWEHAQPTPRLKSFEPGYEFERLRIWMAKNPKRRRRERATGILLDGINIEERLRVAADPIAVEGAGNDEGDEAGGVDPVDTGADQDEGEGGCEVSSEEDVGRRCDDDDDPFYYMGSEQGR